MIRLPRRIAETAISIGPFGFVLIFAGLGTLVSLIFGFDLALSALFGG
jgi:hypothetical protein